MRFDTIDAFLEHFYEKKLNVSDIDFIIDGDTNAVAVDPTATPDVIKEPPPDDVEPQGAEINETITIHLASGDVNVQLDEDNYLVVESVGLIPNTCGTGYVVLDGRKIHLNMCEMDGKTVAYLPTEKGSRTPIPVRVKT